MALELNERWLRRCAWCDRVALGGRFRAVTPAKHARITHTICPECLRTQLALRERPAA
jgi:hypothetical protein